MDSCSLKSQVLFQIHLFCMKFGILGFSNHYVLCCVGDQGKWQICIPDRCWKIRSAEQTSTSCSILEKVVRIYSKNYG